MKHVLVEHYINVVKWLTHGLRSFNGAVQRRLATLMVTMLISSCWQLLSEVELRRIFDVCKRWANSGSYEFVKKNMVRYIRPHRRFAHCSCEQNAAITVLHFHTCSALTACFGFLYRNILFQKCKKNSGKILTYLKKWMYLFKDNHTFSGTGWLERGFTERVSHYVRNAS